MVHCLINVMLTWCIAVLISNYIHIYMGICSSKQTPSLLSNVSYHWKFVLASNVSIQWSIQIVLIGTTKHNVFSTFPRPFYHVTSITVEVTYIFHISTWNFLCVLKNFNKRLDILVWIFHASTSNLSCHLCTSTSDIHIPHFYM